MRSAAVPCLKLLTLFPAATPCSPWCPSTFPPKSQAATPSWCTLIPPSITRTRTRSSPSRPGTEPLSPSRLQPFCKIMMFFIAVKHNACSSVVVASAAPQHRAQSRGDETATSPAVTLQLSMMEAIAARTCTRVWHAQRSASVAPVPLSHSPASAPLTFIIVSGCSFIAAALVRFIACECVGVRCAGEKDITRARGCA